MQLWKKLLIAGGLLSSLLAPICPVRSAVSGGGTIQSTIGTTYVNGGVVGDCLTVGANNILDQTICTTGSGQAIGASVTSGTPGSILFVSIGPVLAQDNANFFWDDTHDYLGIGTATPAQAIDNQIGNISINSAAYIMLNGDSDTNWIMGRGINNFTTALVGGATSIQIVTGEGSAGPDGFAVGGTGDKSYFELDGHTYAAYFRGAVQMANYTAGVALFDSSGNITSGTVPISHGGTNATTLTAHAVLLGEGGSTAVGFATIGTAGRLLLDQGATDPAFEAMSGDVTIIDTGAATVGKIGGESVSLAGSFTMSGPHTFTGTVTGNTTVTFPTTGTLAALSGTNTWTGVQTLQAITNFGSSNQTILSAAGLATKYNGDTTAGNGLNSVVASVDPVSQMDNISTTILWTAPATGIYRVDAYTVVTTGGTGTLTMTLGWTDDDKAQSDTTFLSLAALTAGTYQGNSQVVEVVSGDTITYSTTLTVGSGSPAYSIYITVTRLQ